MLFYENKNKNVPDSNMGGFVDDVSREESSTLIHILKQAKTAENYKLIFY